jgi:hypothetical protein
MWEESRSNEEPGPVPELLKALEFIGTTNLVGSCSKWVATHEEYNKIDVTKVGLPALPRQSIKRVRGKKKQ